MEFIMLIKHDINYKRSISQVRLLFYNESKRGEMKMFSNKELRSMIITLFFEQLLVMLVGIVDTFVVSS